MQKMGTTVNLQGSAIDASEESNMGFDPLASRSKKKRDRDV